MKNIFIFMSKRIFKKKIYIYKLNDKRNFFLVFKL